MTEQTETMEHPLEPPVKASDMRTPAPCFEVHSNAAVSPQAGAGTCSSCGGGGGISPNDTGTISYVYAIGRVEARFPNLAAEKEFAQATGRTETTGKTDQQAFHAVLSQRQNRYLVRQLLGTDHTRPGNLPPAAARPDGYRYAGGCDPAHARAQ